MHSRMMGTVLTVVLVLCGVAGAKIIYVDAESQQMDPSGDSWASAFKTIGEAIVASVADDEIWVKKGTYTLTEPLTVDKALKIYGGFAGTETGLAQRDVKLNLTTVDGNNAAYHCFVVTADATLDGLTITRGNATGPQESDRSGGGVYIHNATAQLTACTISGNQASADGGGVFNIAGEIESQFQNCRFAANTAGGRGGALFSTGGTFDNFDHPKLSNCILVQNGAQDGGALYFDQYASGDILNCTLSGNSAERGGGLFVFELYSYTRVMNTILWGDMATTGHPEIYFVPTGVTGSKPDNLEVYYSDIMTGWDNVSINIGNLNADPAFVDADGLDNNPTTWADNDYRIFPSSPMIDKGTAQHSALIAPTADFLGTPRPQGVRHDIGAYEYASGQGLAFQADFDLDYSYIAPARTQSFAASTQNCDVTWWLGLTNTSGGAETWNLNSVIFETPNALSNFFPTDPVINGNQYTWSNLTITEEAEREARQTIAKTDVAIPFSVTRAYEDNAIFGTGEMTTIVTVTPDADLASFEVSVKVAPAWTEADWWNGLYIGTVEHLSAEVTGGTYGQFNHRDTPELQEYEWKFTNSTSGQPITFTIRTRVTLNPGIPSAYLEPIVTVSGNRTADAGSEVWANGVLDLPDGAGRVILNGASSMLTLDGYLPWYELTLPLFAAPITSDINHDGITDLLDLLILSENWLMPCNAENNNCDGADIDFNGIVNMNDFVKLSDGWIFVDQTGSLRVTLSPQGAIAAGAQWRRVGTTTWFNTDETESEIALGSHTVEFKNIDGWYTPTNQDIMIENAQTTHASGIYGLIAYWKMDDNAAEKVVFDSGPNAINGTAQQDTAALTKSGKIGTALAFNGTTDYINCGNGDALQERTTLTVSAWVNGSDYGATKPYNMVVCGHQANQNFSWGLRIDSGIPKFFIRTGDYYRANATGPALSAGQWYHIAGVWDRNGGTNNLKIYVNGELKGQRTLNANMDVATVNVWIGRATYPGINQYFKGSIDDVRLYHKALSAADILTVYNEAPSKPTISPDGGTFMGSTQVTLTCATPDVTMRYTLDGTEPTSSSTLYTAPFTVNASCTVKAKSFKTGYADSETATLLIRGLLSHWLMDDNSADTTVLDAGDNHLNGTAQQNTAILTTAGKINGALTFNGTTGYVDCGNESVLQERNALTVSAWINGSDYGPTKPYNMVVCGHQANQNFSWGLRIDSGVPKFFVRAGAYYSANATGPALTAGQWYHVVGVWDRNGGTNNLKIYVNGELKGQRTLAANMDVATVNVWIGRANYPGINQYFKGSIDDVWLYNKALSQEEIISLYNEGVDF